MKRRKFLSGTIFGTGAALTIESLANQAVSAEESVPAKDIIGNPRVRGPFPILSTPYTESGEVDYEVLAREARFVDWCGSPGMIWPQSGDSVDLLTMEEKLRGMEVLAETMRGRTSCLCLGVQGKNTEEMLVYAKKAMELEVPSIISRPPDDGMTDDDMRQYWRALAEVAVCPVIIQTTGGTKYKGPSPSVDLLIELGRDFECFGYVKEEAPDTMNRMRKELAAKPAIKRVMSAWGGFGWLHQCRLGTEGLITERWVYADLLAKIWSAYDAGNLTESVDLYAKFLLMMNLRETIPCNQLRGYHLYIGQKRGVFKNRLSREYGPNGSIPETPNLQNMSLSQEEMDELDMRLDCIAPSLKGGSQNLSIRK